MIEDREYKRRVIRVYHDQWGVGRRMYLNLINLANIYYCHCHDWNENRADKFRLSLPDVTQEECELPEEFTFKSRRSFATFIKDILTPAGAWKRIFKNCDNNNGGLVVHIVLNKWAERDKNVFEYGFLMGYEDEHEDGTWQFGDAFSRWLSAEEYASIPCNSRFADAKFMKIFKDFADYFELTEIKETSTFAEPVILEDVEIAI